MSYKFTNSAKLFRKASRYLVGGVNSPVRSFNAVGGSPLFISKAKGQYLYDEDGNRFIDFVGSWGPMILGHCDPDVVRAIKKTSETGISYGAPCEKEIQLASLITRSLPSADKVRMTSSGTEATMSAIRLARGYTGRDHIIKFEGCYHGHADHLLVKAGSGATTFGSPSSSGVPPAFVKNTLLADFNNIRSVERLFRKHRDSIAAVILEPVAGNMGVIPPEEDFLEGLREITEQNGTLLIFDEVITGFRLSKSGAQGLFNVFPDITCLGKIIGGGLPVGAFAASNEIMGQLSPEGPVYQAGTLSGNPIAMSAGVATLSKLNKQSVYNNLGKISKDFIGELSDVVSRSGVNAEINSVGSMFTLFFTAEQVRDYKGAKNCDTQRYAKFFRGLLSRGIMFPPSQFESVLISTVHTGKDLDYTLNAVYSTLKEL